MSGGHAKAAQSDLTGYWGNPTAPIDWCEDNYRLSSYVAELWNTLSNLSYLVVAVIAVATVLRLRLPWTQLGVGVCILITGLFSAMFHATLWFEFQRLDEVFENGILVFMFWDDDAPRKGEAVGGGKKAIVKGSNHRHVVDDVDDGDDGSGNSQELRPSWHGYNLALGAALTHFALSAYGILTITSFLFCEVHFVSMVALIIVRFHVRKKRLYESSAVADAAERLIRRGLLWGALGGVCWLVDRAGCDTMRAWLYGGSLELHVFWHIFTALSLQKCCQLLALLHVRQVPDQKSAAIDGKTKAL